MPTGEATCARTRRAWTRPKAWRWPSTSRSSAQRTGAAVADPARDLSRQGQGRGNRRAGQGARGRTGRGRLRAVARAAAQSGKGLRRQGDRPHRADSGNFRRARPHQRRARCRSNSRISTYQKSRLVRSWTHLERQRGGFGFLGGPGETQIETDRRLIQERMNRIERDLEQVKRRAACTARAGATCLSRSWRWSATPTPANRACSIG